MCWIILGFSRPNARFAPDSHLLANLLLRNQGVGEWILKLIKDLFVDAAKSEEMIQRDERIKGRKPYIPRKISVAYALLIILYRGTSNGTEFIQKQGLIDAAESSGLSCSL
ncbi:hypothetical protein L1987_17840 [Smallanthus sonchifolius]|uniref:Uncharacterized protein n=1 Tax=Smallanthus sonchifolius TaxID=185202 RepID=A0ACB9IYX2_9ASTR|nr:hypothetical protein L1987_17840 [Smallanthus sonchifolius]